MAFLTVVAGPPDGPPIGHRYELRSAENSLGRHPDCHVLVEVGAVSRRHAQVVRLGDQWFVEDLNSRNGTFLNDEQVVGRKPLQDGDQVRICDVSFRFQGGARAGSGSKALDGSSVGTIFLEDDSGGSSSTIMSKVDVSSSRGQIQLAASPEAKLNALIEITQNLGKALELDQVLDKILASLFKIFVQADRAFIGLANDDGVLVPRWTKVRRPDSEDAIRVSRTIVNLVLESRQAILSGDALEDSRFDNSMSIADLRIRSMMCAPLLDSDGKPIGVLHIDTMDQRNRFQQEDLELLVSVAAQAGLAIDNAQLHEAALRQLAMEQDIKLASDVQKAFLPDARPMLDGYEFFHFYEPANHVGGDYFDYIRLPDGRTAVIVADVVGHGVAAALLMAKLSAEARFCLASESQADVAITNLNNRLSRLQIDRFVTLVAVVLDADRHEVTIVNAGHMAPIHRQVDGQLDEPGAALSGLPLGIVEGFEYQQAVIRLEPGESLTMYTDGINEAANERDVQFSIERIRELVLQGDGDVSDLGNSIVNNVQQFLGRATQEDDMCLVCLRRMPGTSSRVLRDTLATATPVQS
ncbi:MAG: SpoIIE family protein phosphatase [Pirellulaceae bacterium]|nr:SpoIIE family protein phosphatase [Pirellulaceae bacterium]